MDPYTRHEEMTKEFSFVFLGKGLRFLCSESLVLVIFVQHESSSDPPVEDPIIAGRGRQIWRSLWSTEVKVLASPCCRGQLPNTWWSDSDRSSSFCAEISAVFQEMWIDVDKSVHTGHVMVCWWAFATFSDTQFSHRNNYTDIYMYIYIYTYVYIMFCTHVLQFWGSFAGVCHYDTGLHSSSKYHDCTRSWLHTLWVWWWHRCLYALLLLVYLSAVRLEVLCKCNLHHVLFLFLISLLYCTRLIS